MKKLLYIGLVLIPIGCIQQDVDDKTDSLKKLRELVDRVKETSIEHSPNYYISGYFKHVITGDSLSGATVFISNEHSEFDLIHSDARGYYSVQLPYERRFELAYSMDGFYTKRIVIDTHGVDSLGQAGGFFNQIDMTMQPKVEGVEIPYLDEYPMSICSWDAEENNMVWDFEMATQAKKAIQEAIGSE